MICMQGYQLVGNDELDCYQGRFNRSIGRCKPSNQHFFLVLCGIRSGRNWFIRIILLSLKPRRRIVGWMVDPERVERPGSNPATGWTENRVEYNDPLVVLSLSNSLAQKFLTGRGASLTRISEIYLLIYQKVILFDHFLYSYAWYYCFSFLKFNDSI